MKTEKTFGECCHEVAVKHKLGLTLVTGHKTSYWIEANDLHAQQFKDEITRLKGESEHYEKLFRDRGKLIALMEEQNESLKADVVGFVNLATEFVKRVEKGEVRSTYTYSEFKKLLSKYEADKQAKG